MSNVVTRFPPSPTGKFHIGSARTALFNYLFAEHHGGGMYLRFEDTDAERNKKEHEEDIIRGLEWLGIPYTESTPLRQSERLDVYRSYLHKLIESGAAYEAEPSEGGGGNVIRFKNPNVRITFSDLIRGEVSFDTAELKDFVIARNADSPLYHLAVVADDQDTGITHVIRGEDHISNTQRQILILEALGFARPVYAHIPLILAPDRSKLSKRHGAISLNEYRSQGFVAEALVNYLALLGWNPGGDRELFTLAELVKEFDITQVQKSGAVFDLQKLRWFNHEYLKRLDAKEYETRFANYIKTEKKSVPPAYFSQAIKIIQERGETFEHAFELLHTDCSFLEETTNYGAPFPVPLLTKGAKADTPAVLAHLKKVLEMLSGISAKSFTTDTVKEAVFPYATEQGRASVLWPLRVALSGKEKSPDPFTLAEYLGKERALARVSSAIEMLSSSSI